MQQDISIRAVKINTTRYFHQSFENCIVKFWYLPMKPCFKMGGFLDPNPQNSIQTTSRLKSLNFLEKSPLSNQALYCCKISGKIMLDFSQEKGICRRGERCIKVSCIVFFFLKGKYHAYILRNKCLVHHACALIIDDICS